METVLQRLGFLVDTGGLMRGQAAMDSAAAAGVRLGQSADLASAKLSTMGRGPAQTNLRNVSNEMDRAANAARAFNTNAEQVNTRMTALGAAAGAVAGIFAFQLLGAITSVVGEIGNIPLEAARAQDALTKFNAQLTIAFRGSADVVRQARNDVRELSREAGVPLAQLRNDYAEMSVVGRSAGLTRSEITDVVGAFAQLGQISGADQGQLARSMYQVQQMMNTGQVRWADFKLADLNLPAFGLAVEQGMDISSAEMVGRVGRGEVTVNELLQALVEGATELLDEAGGQLPQTMARAQAAMESEWTTFLENIGNAWMASEFIQSLQRGITITLRAANGETPQEERARLQGELARGPSDSERASMNRFGGPNAAGQWEQARRARLAELSVIIAEEANSEARSLIEEAAQQRLSRQNSAMGVVTNLDPIRAAQADINRDISAVQLALSDTVGMTSEQIAELTRGLRLLEGQLSRIESATDRARRQMRDSAGDLERYGPGGGYGIASSARGLYEQAIQQMRPISMAQAMEIVRGNDLIRAANDIGQTSADLTRRQGIVDAAGLGVDARRRAALEASDAEFRAGFGNREDMSADQAAEVDRLARARRDNEELRQSQEIISTANTRARIENERISAMREEIAMGVQLGQQGRIALAQAERERQLRLELGAAAEALLPAERARVAENVRIAEQLDLQREQLARLQDAAETAGRAMGDALSSGIISGLRSGQDGIDAILNSLQQSGERILSNLLGNVTAPIERRITEMAGGQLGRIFGRGDADKSVEALSKAATEAADGIASGMTPAVVEAATKTALSTSATATDAAMTSKATLAVSAFGAAVAKATIALEAMAAAGGEETGSSLVSSIASAFSGGSGSPSIPKFARGVRNFSGGLAIVGEEGAELVELPRGSNVYSHNQSKAMMGGGGVSIVINDQRGANAAPVEQRESRGPNGERQIELYIKDQQTKNLASDPDVTAAMSSRFGVRPMVKKS